MKRAAVVLAVLAMGAVGTSCALAADGPEALPMLQGRPDKASSAGGMLGAAYESKAEGIALRPPAGCKEIHRAGDPDDLVEFVNDARNWSLKVSRSTLSKQLPLTKSFVNGREQPGVLELTVDNFKRANPSAEVLREDVTNIGANQVGMIVTRAAVGTASTAKRLIQQAIIQVTEQQYLVLTFMSPGAKVPGDNSDPGEAEAVKTFTAVLDTVQLLDRSSIKDDQDQRLFRTRAFYVNLSDARIKKALVPEQWVRLQRDGKDIGYTYIVEEPAKQGGNDGVKIGVRSRTMPDKSMQVDAETWMFSSLDRRHETWTNVVAIGDGQKQKDYSSEVGYSDVEVSHRVEQDGARDPKDPKEPPIATLEKHTLTVTRSTKSTTAKPIERPLPPWYLPQAMGQILPRLLPLEQPKGYLFASYVSDQGEVMSRYVDVGRETTVELGGQTVKGIPVRDRIGLEGSVTTHWMSPDGKWLGSVNEDSKIALLPSDAATLQKLWTNPDLTRPKEQQPSDNHLGSTK